MVLQVLSKVFGSKNERELKRMRKTVLRINALEDDIEKLSAEALIGQREKLKSRIWQVSPSKISARGVRYGS